MTAAAVAVIAVAVVAVVAVAAVVAVVDSPVRSAGLVYPRISPTSFDLCEIR